LVFFLSCCKYTKTRRVLRVIGDAVTEFATHYFFIIVRSVDYYTTRQVFLISTVTSWYNGVILCCSLINVPVVKVCVACHGGVIVKTLVLRTRRPRPFRFQVTALVRQVVHTHVPLSPSGKFGSGRRTMMPYGWQGNRWSVVGRAMRHRLK